MKLTIGSKIILCNLLFASLLFMISLSACEKEEVLSPEMEYRRIAWESLSDAERQTVTTDWPKAQLYYTKYKDEDVAAVHFNTKLDGLLGPITLYISVSTKKVVGGIPRE